MGNTLLLGVGNLLLSDEGVGIHVVRRLQEVAQLPEDVEVVDGGTSGLELMHHLDGVSRLIVVDAIETGQPPGTLARIAGDQVPAHLSLKISPHEIGLPEMLLAAKLRGLYPDEVVVWGAQPDTCKVGLELSPAVAAQVDVLVEKILRELADWGIPYSRVLPDKACD
jgi:hydrogenase maturation protease